MNGAVRVRLGFWAAGCLVLFAQASRGQEEAPTTPRAKDVGARMIPVRVGQNGEASARVLNVEEFISLVEPATKEEGFFESEISRKVHTYGHIAQVFSTYESRKAKGEEPFVRGINSIQLLNDGKRWWIVTIYWDSERTGQPIPAEYLPEKK
jgi:hypothetical protein